MKKEETAERLRAAIDLIEQIPSDDYQAMREALKTAHTIFHQFVAERFESPLNAHVATLPQSTIIEKRALSRQVNEELRELGLGLRAESGEQAILRARPGNHYAAGCFQVELVGRGRIQTKSSATLFPLRLMPAEPRHHRKLDGKEDDGRAR